MGGCSFSTCMIVSPLSSSSESCRIALIERMMEAAQTRQHILGHLPRSGTANVSRSGNSDISTKLTGKLRVMRRYAMYKDALTGILYMGGKAVPRQRLFAEFSVGTELNYFTISVSPACL